MVSPITNLTKGKLSIYIPSTRQTSEEFTFQFNPSSVKVKHAPNFKFNTAPVGAKAYAQYGSSDPVEVSFELFLINVKNDNGETVANKLNQLRKLAEPVNENGYTAPPIIKVQMGETLSYLDRPFICVMESLSYTIERQDAQLRPALVRAEVTLMETRAYIGKAQE
jgi:hypothetical protein